MMVAHPQGKISVWPWFHQPESEYCTSKFSLSLSVCLSSFPPAHSLADRSEVADQAGRLSAWRNSLPSWQAASCDLPGNFVLLPETLCSTPGLLHCPLPMLGRQGDTGMHVSMATCKMACVCCNLFNVRAWLVCTCIVWKSVNLHINTVRRSEINMVYISVLHHSSSAKILQSANRCVCVFVYLCSEISAVQQADLHKNPSLIMCCESEIHRKMEDDGKDDGKDEIAKTYFGDSIPMA